MGTFLLCWTRGHFYFAATAAPGQLARSVGTGYNCATWDHSESEEGVCPVTYVARVAIVSRI
jgi:hypothetical protein